MGYAKCKSSSETQGQLPGARESQSDKEKRSKKVERKRGVPVEWVLPPQSKQLCGCWLLTGQKKSFALFCPIGRQQVCLFYYELLTKASPFIIFVWFAFLFTVCLIAETERSTIKSTKITEIEKDKPVASSMPRLVQAVCFLGNEHKLDLTCISIR